MKKPYYEKYWWLPLALSCTALVFGFISVVIKFITIIVLLL